MKPTHVLTILLFTLCTYLVSSCTGEEDYTPISLRDIESPNLNLQYPPARIYAYLLQGGDGNYTVSCNQPETVEAKIVSGDSPNDVALSLKTLSRGDAVITIADNSGNSLLVNVKVDYYTEAFVVNDHDTFISGDLSEAEKTEVKEKALRTIPVKKSGGYKFVYTDGNEAKGTVYMYKEKYGEKAVEGTFERRRTEGSEETGINGYVLYELTFAGEKHFLKMTGYQPSRTSVVVPIAFYEDVKELFIADYPMLESVHTAQVLSHLFDLVY